MAEVKTIGRSGQISLGKEFAGRLVMVDATEPGVWVLKLGDFIPENEQWLHESPAGERIDGAIAWAEKNPPRATDLTRLNRRRRR